MILSASCRPRLKSGLLCAIAAAAAIAMLAGCVSQPAPEKPVVAAPPAPPPPLPSNTEKPSYLRLPNMGPGTPVRVGVILPFNNPSAATRALAAAMLKAAELALFDSGNSEILLMPVDEGARPADTAAATAKLIDEGAEIILGPLFGPSVNSVVPLARAHDVPVLAFSTEKSVAGNGVYLLSFMPQNEVRRVVSYAASQGHSHFVALVPSGTPTQTAYGDVVASTFSDTLRDIKGATGSVVRFTPDAGAVSGPAGDVAKMDADAILIAQGGTVLRALAPMLAFDGVDTGKVKFLGTGLWYDTALTKEETLAGGWFAAPAPDAEAVFAAKYQGAFGTAPPPLASLAYDAVSLVALLAPGVPYARFTHTALVDPNGFSGVDGIFRFDEDGTSERGLAILQVTPDGFTLVDPAPRTFQNQGS